MVELAFLAEILFRKGRQFTCRHCPVVECYSVPPPGLHTGLCSLPPRHTAPAVLQHPPDVLSGICTCSPDTTRQRTWDCKCRVFVVERNIWTCKECCISEAKEIRLPRPYLLVMTTLATRLLFSNLNNSQELLLAAVWVKVVRLPSQARVELYSLKILLALEEEIGIPSCCPGVLFICDSLQVVIISSLLNIAADTIPENHIFIDIWTLFQKKSTQH